jgi:uncharacterized protein with gpF-like domain
VSPDGKDITLPGVHANAGVKAKYQAKLDALIAEMQADIVRELTAQYRETPPELAEDASPARTLSALVKRLTAKWQAKFDAAAPDLARYFATAATDRAEGALKKIFKKAGWTVEFDTTRTSNDVFQATLAENVGLIRSIASEHLSEVQGLVMRSVSAGRDLSTLTADLQQRYGVTRRRAKLIALDQNNKATSSIVRTRQIELGLTEAEWMHSGGGKHPRPLHVKAGKEKLRYDIRKGAYIDGKWIFPGEEINCRCVGRVVVPGF